MLGRPRSGQPSVLDFTATEGLAIGLLTPCHTPIQQGCIPLLQIENPILRVRQASPAALAKLGCTHPAMGEKWWILSLPHDRPYASYSGLMGDPICSI